MWWDIILAISINIQFMIICSTTALKITIKITMILEMKSEIRKCQSYITKNWLISQMHFPIENDDNSGFLTKKYKKHLYPDIHLSHVTTSRDPKGPPSFFPELAGERRVDIELSLSVFEIVLDRLRDVCRRRRQRKCRYGVWYVLSGRRKGLQRRHYTQYEWWRLVDGRSKQALGGFFS